MTLIYSFYSDVLSVSKASFAARKLHEETITKEPFSAGLTESMAKRATYY